MAALRFQIIELLYVTAAIGAGCGIAQMPSLSWTDGALATTIFLVVPVTLRESFSLNLAGKSLTNLSPDQNFELRFLGWGRLAAVLVLITALCAHLLAKSNPTLLFESTDFPEHQAGRRARKALGEFALVKCKVTPKR
jgi:hypothetical protein